MSEHKLNIDNIANLARLNISEEEKQELINDMDKIVSYIDLLSQADIDNVNPSFFAMELQNIWRKDIALQTDIKELVLKNAPDTIDNDYIKVPQVLPGDDML